MTGEERTEQVPVSLPTREQIAEAIGPVIGSSVLRGFAADRVFALLSQSTSTAETDDDESGWPEPHDLPPAPPRIEDMASGTTFVQVIKWTVRHTAIGAPYVENDADALPGHSIDPSTIRDVTPPAVSS